MEAKVSVTLGLAEDPDQALCAALLGYVSFAWMRPHEDSLQPSVGLCFIPGVPFRSPKP